MGITSVRSSSYVQQHTARPAPSRYEYSRCGVELVSQNLGKCHEHCRLIKRRAQVVDQEAQYEEKLAEFPTRADPECLDANGYLGNKPFPALERRSLTSGHRASDQECACVCNVFLLFSDQRESATLLTLPSMGVVVAVCPTSAELCDFDFAMVSIGTSQFTVTCPDRCFQRTDMQGVHVTCVWDIL